MPRTTDTDTLVEYLITSLVDDPASASVEKKTDGTATVYEVTVATEDIGKVIGRSGRVIKAIRTVVRAAAAEEGAHVSVEVLG
ncbi:MAG: KH domain-containing protein [Coriobacteriia bacterium]